MKSTETRIVRLALIVVVFIPAATAASLGDIELSAGADAAYNSKYIWRGINLVDDPVFQPDVYASAAGFTFSIWGSMETTDYNDYGLGDPSGDFTEVDWTLDYSFELDAVSVSLGTIYYEFPNTGAAATWEVYAGVAADVPLSPGITVYQDVDEVEGTYASASIGHAFDGIWEPSPAVSVSAELSAALGFGSSDYNEAYYGEDDDTLADASLSLAVPVAVGDYVSLTPSINYSTLVESSIRQAMENDDNLWSGVTLSLSF